MTRFARAKGSKASNQKAPEDSTPWEVMKDQIIKSKKESEEAKHRQEAEQQRIENYTNFLKEQKVQKRKATWCDFPDDNTVNNSNLSNMGNVPATKKKKAKEQKISNNVSINEQQVDKSKECIQVTKKQKKKKKNNSFQNKTQSNDVNSAIQTEKVERTDKNNAEQASTGQTLKKKNKKKKSKNPADIKEDKNESVDNIVDATNMNFQDQNEKINTQDELSGIIKKKADIKKLKNKKNKEPVRRKEINDRSFQLIINGKEIELIRFDGFPIMKKDAERLEELKNSMMKKGIPKTEVQRTMKLERRRAEKALARLKREVCYNCRKGGHNLSDCPDLKSKIPGVDSAEGVCFKCGSTEHRQFECKVQRDKEFRFATCFICKEAGHIARQCPDNPKGLYPNGGCCKLCGDVTHLKKDCPTTNLKKEETSIKLQTLDSTDNIEDINQKVENTFKEGMKKPKKIRF